jgi:hypothetical protein
MTTRTIFPLLLAVAGLAVGCQDFEPKSLPKPKLEAKVEAPQKMEELSALAPPQPSSIAEPKADDKPKEPKLEELVITHDAEPEPMFDRPVDAKDVVIERFVLAKDVAGREPLDEGDHFTSDNAKIFAFVQLANTDEPYAVTVHFEPVDGPASQFGVKLDVPTAPRWRTWAWTKLLHTPGKYRAVLRTLEGEEILAREFTIDEAEVK